MTDSLLAVSSLDVQYGPVHALSDVTFDVRHGTAVAVLGTNGAGKSTLGRALAGLVPAAGGTVTFDGHNISGWPAHKIRQLGLVYVPEGRGIFPGLSVEHNLRMAIRWAPRAEQKAAMARAYDMFAVLAKRRHQQASSMSGGEQQMLALAGALAIEPKLLIADELSLGLAPKIVNEVFDALSVVKNSGVSVILIEQFVHRALGFADRAMVLQRGTVGWNGDSSRANQEVLDLYLGQQNAA